MGKIVDNDKGYKELVKRCSMADRVIDVGILEADAEKRDGNKGASIVDVATWAEFGTATEPERSFLRAFFDQENERCREALAKLLAKVADGKLTQEQALDQFGLWAVGQIQKRIAEGIAPENAPSTIEAKGSSTPLINEGIMRSAVSFRVEKA